MIDYDILQSARAVYTRKFEVWQKARAALDRTVAQAAAAKQPIMSGDYWKAEWVAREQLRSAEIVLELVTDEGLWQPPAA